MNLPTYIVKPASNEYSIFLRIIKWPKEKPTHCWAEILKDGQWELAVLGDIGNREFVFQIDDYLHLFDECKKLMKYYDLKRVKTIAESKPYDQCIIKEL